MTNFITNVSVLATEGGSNGIFGGLTNFFKSMNGGLKGLGLAIAVVCAILLGICIMGGGGNGIQKHKGWAIGIGIGIIVICLAPTVVPAIADAVGSGAA